MSVHVYVFYGKIAAKKACYIFGMKNEEQNYQHFLRWILSEC